MGSELTPTRKPKYEGGEPSQVALVEKKEELQRGNNRSMQRVGDLARTQDELNRELGGELAVIQDHAEELDQLETQAAQSGIMAALARTFSRRRMILQRRSVAEGLLSRYEAASRCLRRASAFSDELRLCALEMQQQVEQIHEDASTSARNGQRAAEQVMVLERALEQLDEGGQDVDQLTADARAQRRDELEFLQRSTTLQLELFQARVEMLHTELGPARALRDTVMELHGEMARFALNASSSLDTAGRRIQALGAAADTPTVIAELQESLGDLGKAMISTEQYVQQAQHLLTTVLPDLNAKLEAGARTDSLALVDDLDEIDRERSRELADRALRDAAKDEVDETVKGS